MKAAFLLIIVAIMAGCAITPPINERPETVDEFMNVRTGGNFTDQGAISLFDADFRFSILLVKDLEWALESIKIPDYRLPYISRFNRSERVSPFLNFGTFGREDVDLTYSVKLLGPDGQFAPVEYHDLVIARSTLYEGMTCPAQEFATMSFNETDTLGIYQFYIIIKDNGKVINGCVMQFELMA